jgi:hypothetical protein
VSSRQMRRFLDSLGSGGQGSSEADGRLSPQDAMARFRQRIEEHAQQTREQKERQARQRVDRDCDLDQLWLQAVKEAQNETSDSSAGEQE